MPLTRRNLLLGAPCALALARPAATRAQAPATVPPPELRSEWPDAVPAQPQGRARMRFLGLTVYDIGLWAPAAVSADGFDRQPLALEIVYRRSLRGEHIAERSLDEMKRAGAAIDEGTASRWLAQMKRLFPDVADGDRITGVQQPGQSARFHVNGRFAGELRDARFAPLFFGIWLAPWTSEPQLRRQLLGAAS
ncbi:MAG: chalcone isomerase family protein [Burkholderiaceae bacterium]